MDPITAAMLLAAGITLAGSLISKAIAAGDRATAEKYYQMALAQYGDAAGPDLDAAIAAASKTTKLASEDPELRARQMGLIGQLSDAGGLMDQSSEAAMRTAEADAARQQRGYQGAVSNQMASRGLSGSGLEYLGKVMGIQGAADSAYRANQRAVEGAEGRRMNRLGMAAGMMGDVRGMDRDTLRAQDAIDRFNAEMLYGSKMDAFNADMKVRGAKAGAYGNMGDLYSGRADDTEDFGTGLSQDVGGGFSTYAAWKARQDEKKKNERP